MNSHKYSHSNYGNLSGMHYVFCERHFGNTLVKFEINMLICVGIATYLAMSSLEKFLDLCSIRYVVSKRMFCKERILIKWSKFLANVKHFLLIFH